MNHCEVCPKNYLPIPGDGPTPCEVFFIGERPGKTENSYNQVFVGVSGQELDETYLRLAGLSRSNVRITNAVKCWETNNRTPSRKEIQGCGSFHIPNELLRAKPRVVVLLGGSACSLAEGVILEAHHGRPRRVTGFLGVYDGWIFPTYHPAAGINNTSYMTQLIEDFEALGRFLRNDYTPDRFDTGLPDGAVLDYRLIEGTNIPDPGKFPAFDTETHGSSLFSIQYSPCPGKAYMVRANSHKTIEALRILCIRSDSTYVFHNANADIAPLSDLGFKIRPSNYVDTMQEAYQMRNLPQGLKTLCYRLFNVTLQSWEDVVKPASIDKTIEWMIKAINISSEEFQLHDYKKYVRPIKGQVGRWSSKPGELEKSFKRIIKHSDGPKYDIWEKINEVWDKVPEYQREVLESRLGPVPILGIGNCSMDQAVKYGCSDADWTGRVARELARRRSENPYQIEEGDEDK